MIRRARRPIRWRGFDININPRSRIGQKLRTTGGFEDAEINIAAALQVSLYPGRTILDVGANIGLHTLAWSPLAPVIAVEPAPRTYRQLVTNITANGLQNRVHPMQTAVSDAIGDVDFFIASDNAFSSLKDTKRLPIRHRVKVPCTTIDALADQLPPIGLLKIDVEGLEDSVIAGARSLLRRDQPVLFVEIYGGTDSNPDPAGTVEHIRRYGYEPFVYAKDAGLLPYEQHRDERYNYFFVPR